MLILTKVKISMRSVCVQAIKKTPKLPTVVNVYFRYFPYFFKQYDVTEGGMLNISCNLRHFKINRDYLDM